MEALQRGYEALNRDDLGLEGRVDGALRELSIPLLLVRHEGCLMFTQDGYDDIVAALPDAARATTTAKPTVDPAFSAILRDFCTKLAGEPQPARD